MPTEIRILIPDPAVLFSLYRWLDADAYLDPGTRIALSPAACVTVALAAPTALPGLAQSYAAWRLSRRRPDEPPVTFVAAPADPTTPAVTVTVTDASVPAIEAILALIPA